MDIVTFKPKKLRISSQEKSQLYQNNEAWCAACKSVKPISEMTLNKTKEYGLGNNCKICENKIAAARREANRIKRQSDTDYAESEREKDRLYRKVKRAEITVSVKDSIINNPLNFVPSGKKVSTRESEALRQVGYKWCSKCMSVKSLEEFSSGAGYCKVCTSNYVKSAVHLKDSRKRYYMENRETILANVSNYRRANKDKVMESKRKYYYDNIDKIKNYRKRYLDSNKEVLKKRWKNYYENNTKRILDYCRDWRKSNLPEIAERNRIRYSTDINYRLRCICRQFVHRMITTTNTEKLTRTAEILGYTPVELKAHIEKQFVPGMSWDNYGEWHIDHIIPISSATNLYEGLKLSQLENLQPLWAEENLKKGAAIV